jgi:hypothetical protein
MRGIRTAQLSFSIGQVLTGGSQKTLELARKHGKPFTQQ